MRPKHNLVSRIEQSHGWFNAIVNSWTGEYARESVMSKPERSVEGSSKNGGAATVESVSDILERETQPLIEAWLARVEKESDLMRIPLNHDERTGHLPHLIGDIISVYVWMQGRTLQFRRLLLTMGICGASKATR